MPNEVVYEVRVKLGEDDYDGPVIDEGRALRALLGEIADGEDDVPVIGLDFILVEAPGEPAVPAEVVTAGIVIKLREMHENSTRTNGDESYNEGYRDAAREALEFAGEEVS